MESGNISEPSSPSKKGKLTPIHSTSSETSKQAMDSPKSESERKRKKEKKKKKTTENKGDNSPKEDKKSQQAELQKRFSKNRTNSKLHVVLQHKRNLLGEIVFKDNPSWILMLNIQAGIRNAVGKNARLIKENQLKETDDIAKKKEFFVSPKDLRFPPEGSKETEPHKTGLFKFRDYCPLVFQHLRQKFGIDPADYLVSLCNTLENGDNALRLLPTPGKSGSLFFFSHDMKYIVKTVPKSESNLLLQILPEYYKHVMEHPNTLLPMFYGLHSVKPHKHRRVRFVIMGNIFATNKKIQQRFDLKGSTLGRVASEQEIAHFKENATYKDLDWLAAQKKIMVGPDMKKKLLDQFTLDCKLLEKLNIMDYSLLVGIHHCEEDEGGCSSTCHPPSNPALLPPSSKDKSKSKDKAHKDMKENKDSKDAKEQPSKEPKLKASKDSHKKKPKKQKSSESTPNPAPNPTNLTSNPTSSPTAKPIVNGTIAAVAEPMMETPKKEVGTTILNPLIQDSGGKPSKTEKKTLSSKKVKSAEDPGILIDNNNSQKDSKLLNRRSASFTSFDLLKENKPSTTTTTATTTGPSSKISSPKQELTIITMDDSEPKKKGFIDNIRSKLGGSSGSPRSDSEVKMASLGKSIQTNYPLPAQFRDQLNDFRKDDGGIQATSPSGQKLPVYYFIGIIDILMVYSLRKKAEHAYKATRFKHEQVSSVNPSQYSARFQKFIGDNVQ